MKAILFDLDGTIIDSFEGIAKSAQFALDYYGIHVEDLEQFRVFVGPPLIDSFMKHYGFDRDQAVEATNKYRERYQPIGMYECALYPGVEECLRELRNQGYRIGMASSKPEVLCRGIMDHFGLTKYFDDIVGSTMDAKIDTKAEVIAEVKRRWPDLANDEMILIGDTLYDVEGATQSGIKCVVVSYGFGNVEQMLAAGAVHAMDSIMELPEYLARS